MTLLFTSGLDDGGDGGNGPNIFWDNSISLALSDLCTPGRKPSGRLGGAMSKNVKLILHFFFFLIF